jgi:mono/diheme cytochrome c family protein
MRSIWIATALAVLAGAVAGHSVVTAASAEKGKVAFMKYGCWQCHGTVGQGGNAGPKLAPEPLPQDAFVSFVRTTNRQMPPYHEAVLSNEDLADIYAYLQAQPKAANHKDIPLLNQ